MRRKPVVYNESHLPKREVGKLITFVNSHFKNSGRTFLHLRSIEGGKAFSQGVAYQRMSLYDSLYYNLPKDVLSKVELDVGSGLVYPVLTQHRKSTGRVQLDSWQEEFVLLLSHELRHIDQFWDPRLAKQREVDAEKHAIKVLNLYKQSIPAKNLWAGPNAEFYGEFPPSNRSVA